MGAKSKTLRSIFLFITILVQGCTSVQWRDKDGVDHHVGLFIYEIKNLARGSQFRRMSIGLDLRLSGQDRGVSVGLKSIKAIKPVVFIKSPDELADEVVDYLNDRKKAASQEGHAIRGLFYLSEDVSSNVTVMKTTNFGVEWRRGPVSPGLTIGYTSSWGNVGRALTDGIVQIYIRDKDEAEKDELTLWILQPTSRAGPQARRP